MSIILIGLPVFIASFYVCHIDKLEDDNFTESYGNIYEGLVLSKSREKRLIALFYPFWFVTRRLIFATICIVAEDDFWLQVSAAFFTSMVNVCYLCKYQPFEDRKVLKLEVMNEITNFLLLYHVMCFTGLVPEAEDRYAIGWSFIALISLNMAVHFTLLVIETIRNFKKRCCTKKVKQDDRIVDKKNELSVIYEDEFESNFSETSKKDNDKISCSEWDSKLGGSEEGYNMQKIKWNDLGQKYVFKRGRKSMIVQNSEQMGADIQK